MSCRFGLRFLDYEGSVFVDTIVGLKRKFLENNAGPEIGSKKVPRTQFLTPEPW